MRFLLYSQVLFFLISCKSDYKLLTPASADQTCVDKISPRGIETSWFTTSIDVVGKHMSGLLFIKRMDDGSSRIVFTNEAGVKFFDFEFTSSGEFNTVSVIPQLDKKAVINTLRKDFELLLGIPFRKPLQAWTQGNEIYYGAAQKKETAYFITDRDCASLQRMELGSKRKRKVTVTLVGSQPGLPESVSIHHHTFAMDIVLKKLVKD